MNIKDRIRELRRVKASELLPHPKNWRVHPDSQQNAMREILAQVGFADAVLVRETKDGLQLIDGHLRAEIAPNADIPVLVLDVTEQEADLILATHDPLAAMAETNQEALAELAASAGIEGDALSEIVADLAELDDEVRVVDEDDPPEPPDDPITQPGDIWVLGRHRLLCGDCRTDMTTCVDGASINLAFTSPPYARQRDYDESSGFTPIPEDEYVAWWSDVQSAVANCLADDGSFFVNIKPSAADLDTSLYVFDLVIAMVRQWGWHFATEFCWERSGIPKQVVRRFKNQFEPIYQFTRGDWKMRAESVRRKADKVPIALGAGAGDTNAAKRQGRVSAVAPNKVDQGLAYPGNRLPTFAGTHEALGHAAAFPVGLPSFFIQAYTDENDSVLDPFMGSGSTLIAAEQLNRQCYGMEISPAYCDVIVARWENLTGEKAVGHSHGT